MGGVGDVREVAGVADVREVGDGGGVGMVRGVAESDLILSLTIGCAITAAPLLFPSDGSPEDL